MNSLDFSPDGRWLASCEQGGGDRGFGGITARVWNVETGALHAVIPIPGWGNRVAFSPNSEQLAVSFNQAPSFVIVELATGSTRTPPNILGAGGFAWSPDGTELVCSHGDNHLRVWDAMTFKVLRDVEAPFSKNLEWSRDGESLALLTDDRKVAIRDAKTLEIRTKFGSSGVISFSQSLAWLPDSRRLLVAQESVPTGVFDAVSGEPLATFAGTGNAFSIALCKNGQEAVLEASGRLVFYDTSTGQKLREGKERGAGGRWTMLARNGQEVFASEFDQVVVFNAATGQLLRAMRVVRPWMGHTSQAHPSPESELLAVTVLGYEQVVAIADSQTGNIRHEFQHGEGKVSCAAWSPDGKWLATGATDKLVRVWNVATGKIEHELAGHTGTIWSLAWSPDGTRLASAAEDKTVRLWEVTDPTSTTRERVVEPEKTTRLRVVLKATYDQFPEAMVSNKLSGDSLSWTTDSRRLWIALGGNIVPLDVETGTFGPLENFSNGANPSFLGTSPDGQRQLVWDHGGWTFVRGRDAQDRRLLGQHLGWTAQWHPDSRRFLGRENGYGTVGFDVETNRRLGLLFPWLTGDHWLCLGPTGHYRGSPGVEDQIVYVAMLADGSQRTYTPAEFAKTFGWKNDPEKAELLGK